METPQVDLDVIEHAVFRQPAHGGEIASQEEAACVVRLPVRQRLRRRGHLEELGLDVVRQTGAIEVLLPLGLAQLIVHHGDEVKAEARAPSDDDLAMDQAVINSA